MLIKTKFNIGDKVWISKCYPFDQEIVIYEDEIDTIEALADSIDKDEISVFYSFSSNSSFIDENKVFKTKEECEAYYAGCEK